MFFCSLCGCPAGSHEVDAAWAREEAQRKAAEAAAASRRASAAAAAASAQAAGRAEEAAALALLGLSPAADARSIARAYKRLALSCHPDKLAGGDAAAVAEAHERWNRLQAAYKLLSARASG